MTAVRHRVCTSAVRLCDPPFAKRLDKFCDHSFAIAGTAGARGDLSLDQRREQVHPNAEKQVANGLSAALQKRFEFAPLGELLVANVLESAAHLGGRQADVEVLGF